MPSIKWSQTQTGLSSTVGFATFFPDTMIRPFALTVQTVGNSSTVYNCEHTLDGGSSGFISSNANWFQNSTMSGAVASLLSNYSFPVFAVRLNTTAGSSTGQVTISVLQAG